MDYIIRSDEDKARLWRVMQGLAPKAWRVSITAYRARRTLPQNARWQVLAKAIADETGDDPESVKRDLKVKFGFYERADVNGEAVLILKSTKGADVAEMNELMERAEAFAAQELGVVLGH